MARAPKPGRRSRGAEAGAPKPGRRSPFLGALRVIGRVPTHDLRLGATRCLRCAQIAPGWRLDESASQPAKQSTSRSVSGRRAPP